jgi:hypothetical protein
MSVLPAVFNSKIRRILVGRIDIPFTQTAHGNLSMVPRVLIFGNVRNGGPKTLMSYSDSDFQSQNSQTSHSHADGCIAVLQ